MYYLLFTLGIDTGSSIRDDDFVSKEQVMGIYIQDICIISIGVEITRSLFDIIHFSSFGVDDYFHSDRS